MAGRFSLVRPPYLYDCNCRFFFNENDSSGKDIYKFPEENCRDGAGLGLVRAGPRCSALDAAPPQRSPAQHGPVAGSLVALSWPPQFQLIHPSPERESETLVPWLSFKT